jgi:hypothetical protein
MVNVNETTPKLTRPEQTTQKCRQTAFKMSTLQQCQVSSLWSHTHIVKYEIYLIVPSLFVMTARPQCALWSRAANSFLARYAGGLYEFLFEAYLRIKFKVNCL